VPLRCNLPVAASRFFMDNRFQQIISAMNERCYRSGQDCYHDAACIM